MARIQILELPAEEVDAVRTTPFLIVVDQYDGPTHEHAVEGWNKLAERCGARHVFLTGETVDIPMSTTAQIGTVSVKVEPDLTAFEEGVRASIERAQAAIVDAVKGPEVGLYVGDKRIDEA